jgi:ArsR family transcriptional regulator
MRDFTDITKALADANRTRVAMFLRGGEMCVCQIVEMLGLAPSTVSKHLDVLHKAGLVDSRKSGRWIYYRLPDNPPACVRDAIAWLHASLAKDPQVLADAKRLKAVLKMDKDKLCCRYKG